MRLILDFDVAKPAFRPYSELLYTIRAVICDFATGDEKMATYRNVLIACEFGRGGFSHERVFLIPTPDGAGVYRGLAYIDYCFLPNRGQLPPGEPPIGTRCKGLVSGRIIRENPKDGLFTVQVPDGELCDVDPSIIQEEIGHVSVG